MFLKKFPNKIEALDRFFAALALSITIVKVSYRTDDESLELRDPNDKPVLRAAIESNCDLLISGDKDFLEANLKHPRVIKASEFYNNY